MLKYQVKSSLTIRPSNTSTNSSAASSTTSSASSSPSVPYSLSMSSLLMEDTLLGIPTTSRSNSLLSLSSNDSTLSSESSDVGFLKVDTRNVKQCTDYKTIRVSTNTSCRQVVEKFLSTLKLTCRDPNLFELWMELTTRASGSPVVTLLKLDSDSRPFELQRCHPIGMSRFILHQNPSGFLVRIHDHNISPQSNYKSLLLSPHTTVYEAVQIVLSLNRKHEDCSKYGLFLSTPEADAQIPHDISLVSIARLCKNGQKIIIRNIDFL